MPKKRKPSKGAKRQKVNMQSADITADRLAGLRGLLPEAFTEGKVDFDRLRQALGEEVDDRPERYSFTWAGKRDAMRLLQVPSRATLVPCPQESVDWDTTQNLFIEGENLEVLKLLYKSYAGRVKMIYIDPPYNTGNDFIYPDDFRDPLQTYLKLTGQKDTEGNLLTSNPETSGRYHSAWLSMMYPRLLIGRQLLREDGVLLVSISDVELHNLLLVMNELFGEENQLAVFLWKSRAKPTNAGDAIYKPQRVGEYVLAYGRNGLKTTVYSLLSGEKRSYPHRDGERRYRTTTILTSNRGRYQRETMRFEAGGFKPSKDQRWKAGPEVIEGLFATSHIDFRDGIPFRKHYEDEEKEEHDPLWTFLPEEWTGTAESGKSELSDLVGPDHGLDSVKPVELMRVFLQAFTGVNDLVMDFFTGSCTTAHAVLELNREELNGGRRFVMVQLPEPTPNNSRPRKAGFKTVADIGKERLRQMINRLQSDQNGKLDLKDRKTPEDLGFKVFKLAASNYRPWKGVETKDGAAYADTMEMFADPLLPGWKPINVLNEVALKEGYSLTSKIEKVEGLKDNTVYLVTDPDKGQSFRICLDDTLKPATVRVLALKKDDLFICRDSALTDEQAANLALQCNLKTI